MALRARLLELCIFGEGTMAGQWADSAYLGLNFDTATFHGLSLLMYKMGLIMFTS